MTSSIYEQHKASFGNVSAYVIAKEGKRVATIAFKFPSDGAGRLYAYVHYLGLEMVRGYAGGGGYDKRTAACSDAADKLSDRLSAHVEGSISVWEHVDITPFIAALAADNGYNWEHMLTDAGYDVWQAV